MALVKGWGSMLTRFIAAVLLVTSATPMLATSSDQPRAVIIEVNARGTAEELDQSITIPIECAVLTLSGIETLTTRTRGGQSRIEVRFSHCPDSDDVLALKRAVAAIRSELPGVVSEPLIYLDSAE
jgi:multidrug efflux pump subunit AcrB